MGTTQLLSVPYALHANTAGSNTAGSTSGSSGGFSHYIGELFGGGILVSVWKTAGVEHGLIASLTNLSSGIPWTTPAFQEILVEPTAQSFRDGLANTNAIVAQAGVSISYAAGLCKAYNAGGFTDWYLPAFNELQQSLYLTQVVNEILGDTNGFQRSYYWSSTEYTDNGTYFNRAMGQGIYSGAYTTYNDKANNGAVRAVRRF
jgi:hypothetical protein